MDQQICPSCTYTFSETFYFCPQCGKKLKEPPVLTTIKKQISIYTLSIFLPPFGLIPGIKYLLQTDQKAKKIGIITIVLTIISSIITTLIVNNAINELNTSMNNQIKQYQNLGF